MLNVEPIKVLNVDGETFEVASMSENVQRLVEYYNDWRENEAKHRSALLMTQAGMRDLSREIIGAIRKEQEDAAAAAVAANDAPVADPAAPVAVAVADPAAPVAVPVAGDVNGNA